MFGFTSIVANTYYGESSLRFIYNNDRLVTFYRVLVLAMVFWGAIGSLPLIWAIADITMGVMTFVNLIAILILSRQAFALLNDFEQQCRVGITPIFSRNNFPGLDTAIDDDVWAEKQQKNHLHSD